MSEFNSADYTQKEYEAMRSFAIGLYKAGEEPKTGMTVKKEITAGYGRIDKYGYFEYSLPVDQKTGKVSVETTEDF
ncbi:hypothetical protein N9937_00310 [bacterium]|nr:hypothetical protein [bacterium]